MIKEKKCKGTGKAKGHGCGEMRTYRTYGLGRICCLRKWYFSTEEGMKKVTRATLKATKASRSLARTEKNMKSKTETSAALHNTKRKVHGYVNKRDKYKPCISCGCQWNRDFEAGHLFSANNYRSIKYNLHNINGQCYECNHQKNGNEAEYLIRLPKRIGKENVEELKRLAILDRSINKHWEMDELEAIRKNIVKLTKELD